MNRVIFYIPFLYSFSTRLNTNKKRAAWVLTYVFPFYLATLLSLSDGISFLSALSATVSMIAIYTAYEIGYIVNDAVVVHREVKPTLRLIPAMIDYYNRFQWVILLARILLLVLFLIISYFFYDAIGRSTIISCSAILLLYLLYNSIRNIFNIPLYSALVFFRYFGAVTDLSVFSVFYLFMVYPFPSMIEFSAKERFNLNKLKWVKFNPDLFRVLYYVGLSFVSMSLIGEGFYFLVLYFLIYRLFSFFIFSRSYRL